MISPEIRKRYTVTIGIECHVQLKTKTKLFAAVDNDAREAPPNTLVSHICFGLPGALPVLNREAVRLAVRAAFALGTSPAPFSKFDRKHYFYPDLPKGYQISQYDEPIIAGGAIDVPLLDEATKEQHTIRVGIVRAHLEEDAGKSTHPAGKDYSLVDLNRAGTPLLEIVSKPDMHSAAEAKAYAHELYLRMKYAGISDCDLYLGHMRFDVNVSVSHDPAKLGIRTETKNLNSFRSVEKAIEYEVNRQIEVLEKNQPVMQETRGWDDAKQRTFTQRTKEEAHDYRYMPDPDLPPVVLDEAFINGVRAEMPVMPEQWRERFNVLGYDKARIEDLLDIHADVPEQGYLSFIEKRLDDPDFARFVANVVMNIYEPFRTGGSSGHRSINPKWQTLLQQIYELVQAGSLSSTKYKELILDLNEKDIPIEGIKQYAVDHDYIQVSDEGEIAAIVSQVLSENEKAAQDVKNGEMKVIGFLVGQVMKASKGKANPGLAQELIKKQLGL